MTPKKEHLGVQLLREREALRRIAMLTEAAAYHRNYKSTLVEIHELVNKIRKDHDW